MNNTKIIICKQAQNDLENILVNSMKISLKYSIEIEKTFYSKINFLKIFPKIYQIKFYKNKFYRIFYIKHYSVIYEIKDSNVYIKRIINSKIIH